MIPEIKELNFPKINGVQYATLHQATVSFQDMGEKTITTQVKIDGSIAPEFIGTDGEDWALEFKGEKYIHPLRKPQATKNNESRYSLIDMTFYHWAIYQMKRYFFVSLANVLSGEPIADKYIVPMNLSLEDFAHAISDNLEYYFPNGEIYVYKSNGRYINPDLQDYDTQVKALEINYTYIWDLLQKTQELYDCRWRMEQDSSGNYAIKFGYPVTELTHIFKYGYEGGLLGFERQVQDANIRNLILGRGGQKNLPRLYFKDYEQFHPNNAAYSNYGQIPDPDAIPELESIFFSELRDSNFRSYIQGWKTNPHRQLSTDDGWEGTIEAYDSGRAETDWAYKKGHEDNVFDPVEYVKDDESIATYGLLQGGLENNDDIFPSIQGMSVELPCVKGQHDEFGATHNVSTLADEVVAVEDVITDEISAMGEGSARVSETEFNSPQRTVSKTVVSMGLTRWKIPGEHSILRSAFFTVPEGYKGYINGTPKAVSTVSYIQSSELRYNHPREVRVVPMDDEFVQKEGNATIVSYGVFNATTNLAVSDTANLTPGRYYMLVEYEVDDFEVTTKLVPNDSGIPVITDIKDAKVGCSFAATCVFYDFNGAVVDNGLASASHSIAAGDNYTFALQGSTITIPASGALMVEVPSTVTPKEFAMAERTLRIIDASTLEPVSADNLPAGTYNIYVDIKVTNLDRDNAHNFKAELGHTFIYYDIATDQWKPTFDIWIKNIFNSNRSEYGGGPVGDSEYVAAVWEPLYSPEEMAVTFVTGNLSYSTDWEFKVASGGIHYDNSKTIIVRDEDGLEHEVRSEWRLTLIKSEAESDAIHKYIPYKGYNAAAHDRFFFTGIYLPWAYVYAAEKELTESKEEKLGETKEVQPTWVVSLDKVRIHQAQGAEIDTLINRIHVGDHVRVKDDRFTPEMGIQLYITSISYTWNGDGGMLPDVEIVLSDKVGTSLSTVEQIRSDVEVVSNHIKTFNNLERTIRKIGDSTYLRKDGLSDTSYSPTSFTKPMQSSSFRSGIIGGEGWSAYMDADGNAILEADKLLVRKEMQVNNLVINQVSAAAGKEILSAASITVSHVDATEDGYVCFFEQHGGTVGNLFQVNDIAMSQVFDANNNQTKYYRRLVTEVGEGYIVLSQTAADGESTPQEGDVIVQFGNTTDASRQYVIIRDVIGGGYEQMLSGLDSITASGSEYYFAGGAGYDVAENVYLHDSEGAFLLDADGKYLIEPEQRVVHRMRPRWFVGNQGSEYAEWLNGTLVVKGTILAHGSDGAYHNVAEFDYLKSALKEYSTIISGGLVLSTLIGVRDSSNVLVAGINASTQWQDNEHGKLMMFAGANDAESVPEASFRVYADGTIFANKLTAEAGCYLGGFQLIENALLGMSVIASHYTSPTYPYRDEINIFPTQIDIRSINTLSDNEMGSLIAGWGLNKPYISDWALLTATNNRNVSDASHAATNIGIKAAVSGTGMSHKGIDVEATGDATNNYAIYAKAAGTGSNNFAFYAENGMFGGLRPYVKYYTQSASLAASNLVHTLIINNSAAATFTLPSSPEDGQEYEFWHMSERQITISAGSNYIFDIIDAQFPTQQISYTNRGIIKVIYSASAQISVSGTTVTGSWFIAKY